MSTALKVLELLELELRLMKPMEASGIAVEVEVEVEVEEESRSVKVDQKVKKKKPRRKSHRSETMTASHETAEPAPLTETKVTVVNDADEPALNSAAQKQKKYRPRLSRRNRTGLVAGSHEAGD